jgi:hypothetical protein
MSKYLISVDRTRLSVSKISWRRDISDSGRLMTTEKIKSSKGVNIFHRVEEVSIIEDDEEEFW